MEKSSLLILNPIIRRVLSVIPFVLMGTHRSSDRTHVFWKARVATIPHVLTRRQLDEFAILVATSDKVERIS